MAGIKEHLIQFILRGKDELSPEAKKSTDAFEALRNEAASLNEQLDSIKGKRGLVRDMLAKVLPGVAAERAVAERGTDAAAAARARARSVRLAGKDEARRLELLKATGRTNRDAYRAAVQPMAYDRSSGGVNRARTLRESFKPKQPVAGVACRGGGKVPRLYCGARDRHPAQCCATRRSLPRRHRP